MEVAISFLIILLIIVALTVMANLALGNNMMRLMVIWAILAINVLIVLNILVFIYTEDVENAALGLGITVITVFFASITLLEPVRVFISAWFPKAVAHEVLPSGPIESGLVVPILAGGEIFRLPITMPTEPSRVAQNEVRGFDPKNTVHMVAIVFCLYLFGTQLASFVLGGGLSGVAEDTEVNFGTLMLNFIPLVIIPMIGVGLGFRRSWPEVCERLGLTNPTFESLGIATVVAGGLFFMQIILVMFWIILVGQDTFEAQTEASSAIAESINTVWLAFGVAFAAAVGEELAFRGALQPIFGLWWTSALFTLIHMQYTLTPATLIIFFVAVGFGWLRRRYNLYAAILAHFLYNFVPLLLQVAIS